MCDLAPTTMLEQRSKKTDQNRQRDAEIIADPWHSTISPVHIPA